MFKNEVRAWSKCQFQQEIPRRRPERGIGAGVSLVISGAERQPPRFANIGRIPELPLQATHHRSQRVQLQDAVTQNSRHALISPICIYPII